MDMTVDSFLLTYGRHTAGVLIIAGFFFHSLGFTLSQLLAPRQPPAAATPQAKSDAPAKAGTRPSRNGLDVHLNVIVPEPGQVSALASRTPVVKKQRPPPGDVLLDNDAAEFKYFMSEALVAKSAEGFRLADDVVQPFDFTESCWSGLNSSWKLKAGDRDFIAKVIHSPRDETFDLWETYHRIDEMRRSREVFRLHLCPAHMLSRALEVTDEAGNTKAFDVVIMDFVEGKTLLEFVKDHVTSDTGRQELRLLAAKFRYMVQQFHKEGAVHGDYNSKNIVVNQKGDLILIDLDTFCQGQYAPAVATRGSEAFQCALRLSTPSGFLNHGRKADYFGEWIIYASLVAYVETGDTQVNEGLFFDLTSYKLPGNRSEKAKFDRLKNLNHPILTPLVTQIERYMLASAPLAEMEPLEKLCLPAICETWEDTSAA